MEWTLKFTKLIILTACLSNILSLWFWLILWPQTLQIYERHVWKIAKYVDQTVVSCKKWVISQRTAFDLKSRMGKIITIISKCFQTFSANWGLCQQDLYLFYKWITAWKVFKYRVFSGPYFSALGLNTER